jgi:hypothetical protein
MESAYTCSGSIKVRGLCYAGTKVWLQVYKNNIFLWNLSIPASCQVSNHWFSLQPLPIGQSQTTTTPVADLCFHGALSWCSKTTWWCPSYSMNLKRSSRWTRCWSEPAFQNRVRPSRWQDCVLVPLGGRHSTCVTDSKHNHISNFRPQRTRCNALCLNLPLFL